MRVISSIVRCIECDKPRVLHAAKKLNQQELFQLDKEIDDMDFSCGSTMKDFIPEDEEDSHVLSKVYCRADLGCSQPLEIPYYSSGSFPHICIHCAECDNLLTGDEASDIYPTCGQCMTKPKQLKRKRKLFKAK